MALARSVVSAVMIALLIAPAAVLAEKGGKHTKGKHEASRQEHRHESRAHDEGDRGALRFTVEDRRAIRGYYGGQARAGKCPPGLAKKSNGCVPPGQAKKWTMGRPLPSEIAYYDLPQDLLVRLPPPPTGHRYVQVASDILMIAVGSSMVVDAIQDILR